MEKLVSVRRAKKHLKLKILVSKFVPWDLAATRNVSSRQPAMIARFLSLRVASILGVFLALLTRTSFTTPHYYPKYEVWAIEIFLWYDPFK